MFFEKVFGQTYKDYNHNNNSPCHFFPSYYTNKSTIKMQRLPQFSSQNFLNSENLDLKFVLRSEFGYMAQQIWPTTTYYKMKNMKSEGTKHISN